jgi:hypothetical protein
MPEPLILLPSQLCNEHIWDHQVDALADLADVRPMAPPDGDSMQQLAATLLDSGPERFALVAHGMGGSGPWPARTGRHSSNAARATCGWSRRDVSTRW